MSAAHELQAVHVAELRRHPNFFSNTPKGEKTEPGREEKKSGKKNRGDGGPKGERRQSPGEVSPLKVSPIKVSPIKVSPIKVSPIKVSPIKVSPLKVSPIKVSPIKVSPQREREDKSQVRFSSVEYIIPIFYPIQNYHNHL